MNKAFKIILFVIGFFLIAFFGLTIWTKSHSPADTVKLSTNGLDISVTYSRPYKKGRVIFGELVPYGEVWRTGANEATVIDFNQDVKIASQDLKAGEYTLWTVPGESSWTIIFNEETGQWGTDHDPSKDILTVEVPAKKVSDTLEQFTIELHEASDAEMILSWENTVVGVPILKNE